MAEAATGPASQENFEMHRHEDEGKRKTETELRVHRLGKETGLKRRRRNTGLEVIAQTEQWGRDRDYRDGERSREGSGENRREER